MLKRQGKNRKRLVSWPNTARTTLTSLSALNWFTASSSVQASKRLISCPGRQMKPLLLMTSLRKDRYPAFLPSRGSKIVTPLVYNRRATGNGRPLFVLSSVAGSILTIMPIGRRPLFLRWKRCIVPSLLGLLKWLTPALLLALLRLLRLPGLRGLHRCLLAPVLRCWRKWTTIPALLWLRRNLLPPSILRRGRWLIPPLLPLKRLLGGLPGLR